MRKPFDFDKVNSYIEDIIQKGEIPKLPKDSMFLYDGDIYFEKRTMTNDYPLHWHEYMEIELITSGYVDTYINSDRYRLKKGDAVLLTPLDFHRYVVEPDTEVELINISFTSSSLFVETGTQIHMLLNKYCKCNLSDKELFGILFILDCLFREYEQDLPRKALTIKQYLGSVCLFIINKYEQSLNAKKDCIPFQAYDKDVIAALVYIQEHFEQKCSLEEVAKAIHISKNYLSEKFKQKFGCSYTDYIVNLRLEKACQLVEQTEQSYVSISECTGFSSPQYFSYSFKKKFGMSPANYRKKRMKQNNGAIENKTV